MVPKRVFFSFDFVDDLWRASVVRNRWVMDPALAAGGFWSTEFTSGQPPAHEVLTAFIDEQIEQAEVTAVLIGMNTARCEHVGYAIRRSAELGRGLLGIYVDKCKDRYGRASSRGPNPFELIRIDRDGELVPLSDVVMTYDWVTDDGFHHLRAWISEAMARAAARTAP
jgi:antiphage defense system Thoeris ThsB-like protein